jgi:competence protein ComEC
MRLPALWLAAAFGAGVWLAASRRGEAIAPATWLALALLTLAIAFICLRRERLVAAWTITLFAWFCLGGFGAAGERAALPANHVTRLISSGALDTSEALRWRGRLRSDPLRLPWGLRYEADLQDVELAGKAMPVTGGLRVTYYASEQNPEEPPQIRAGDAAEFLTRARPPRNFQNPGSFDFRAHLARQGVHLTATLRSMDLLRALPPEDLSFLHRLARLRGALLAQLEMLFGTESDRAAVLRAMLLGDASFLDREVSDAFQKTAVYHVLVISGMHVAALAGFLWWVGRRMRLPAEVLALLVLAAVIAFALIVEDKPPVERAACMAALVLVAGLMFRQVDLLQTVAVAALALLVAAPSNLTDPSFQLSFLAVGIIAGVALPLLSRTSVPLRRALSHLSDVTRDAAHSPRATQLRLDLRAASVWLAARFPQRLAERANLWLALPLQLVLRVFELALVSLAVQLCLLPLMAHFFHRVSFSGVLANLPAAILSALIIPFGLLTLALGAIWPGLAKATAWLTGLCATWLLESVRYFSDWNWSNYRIPNPPLWLLMLFLLLLGVFAVASVARRTRAQIALAGVLALLIVLCATHPFAPQLAAEALEVTVLDVGQGDSIFVAFPGGHTMLVDGGGAPGARSIGGVRTGIDIGETVVSDFLWSRGLKRLDVVALSHAHQDHLEGLRAVLANFRVGELWVGRDVALDRFRSLLALAESRGTRILRRHRGQTFQLGAANGRILWPKDSSQTAVSSNNDSLVMRIDFAEQTILLPGDIETSVEEEIVGSGEPLRANFLKVPHHGSRTSASAALLAAVKPQVAVMSFGGANPFGHPHRELLERLAATRAVLLRTDRDGAVTALAGRNGLRVSTFVSHEGR